MEKQKSKSCNIALTTTTNDCSSHISKLMLQEVFIKGTNQSVFIPAK